jgi:hypothetical protein
MCSSSGSGPVQALAAVRSTLSDAVRDGVEDLSHDQCAELMAQLRATAAQVDALTLDVLGKVEADGTFALDGAVTAGSWMRAVSHATPGEAARAVRTARVLRSGLLPNTAAALAAGAISARHAAVIADGVTGAPAGAVELIEPEVVATAVEGDVRATAAVMRAFQHALDPERADEAALRRYERAGITLAPTLGGTFAIHGTADEATGARVQAAIDSASPLLPGETRTAARRRLDGLDQICRHWLDTGDIGEAAEPDGPTEPDARVKRTGRSRSQLVVTLDSAGLLGETSPGGTLSWAGPITASTAARLGCDAQVTFVTLDSDGQVVEAGTSRRFFTAAQRRAIIARDGHTCPVPFCDRPSAWADGHHLKAWPEGPTTVANGVLPCEAHHLWLHEGRWTLERLPDGRYVLRHPATGRTLGPEPSRPGHSRPPPAPPLE